MKYLLLELESGEPAAMQLGPSFRASAVTVGYDIDIILLIWRSWDRENRHGALHEAECENLMPESELNFHVERTPSGDFVEGRSAPDIWRHAVPARQMHRPACGLVPHPPASRVPASGARASPSPPLQPEGEVFAADLLQI
jgi:hypothetical protein